MATTLAATFSSRDISYASDASSNGPIIIGLRLVTKLRSVSVARNGSHGTASYIPYAIDKKANGPFCNKFA